jgi:hypothetical protein
LDHALELMAWFKNLPELKPELSRSLAAVFDPVEGSPDTALYLGDLPELDLLLSLLIRDWRLKTVLEEAAAFLKEKGITVKPYVTVQAVKESGVSRVITLCGCHGTSFDRAMDRITLNELAGMGSAKSVIEGIINEKGFRFGLSPQERQALVAELTSTSSSLSCPCPHEVAQIMLLKRQGGWQSGFVGEPHMVFSDSIKVRAGEAEE